MPKHIDDIILDSKTADPSTPENGQEWYRSDVGQFRGRRDESDLNFLMEGDAADLPFDNVLTVSQTNPAADYSTIQAALDNAHLFANHVCILIDDGDYTSEGDLSFGHTDLTSLTIKAVNRPYIAHANPDITTYPLEDHLVKVISFTCIANNQNLSYLAIEGISNVSGGVDLLNLRAVVDGATNLLGATGIFLRSCSGSLITITGAARIWIEGCHLASPKFNNYSQCVIQSCQILGPMYCQYASIGPSYRPAEFVDSDIIIKDTGINRLQYQKNLDTGTSPLFTFTSLNSNIGYFVIWDVDATIELGIGSTTGGVENTGVAYDLVLNGGIFTDQLTYSGTLSQASTITFGANEINPEPNTFYVDAASGHDLFNGSRKYPFETIQAAIDACDGINSTIVKISAGVYNEHLMLNKAYVHLKGIAKHSMTPSEYGYGENKPVVVNGVLTYSEVSTLYVTKHPCIVENIKFTAINDPAAPGHNYSACHVHSGSALTSIHCDYIADAQLSVQGYVYAVEQEGNLSLYGKHEIFSNNTGLPATSGTTSRGLGLISSGARLHVYTGEHICFGETLDLSTPAGSRIILHDGNLRVYSDRGSDIDGNVFYTGPGSLTFYDRSLNAGAYSDQSDNILVQLYHSVVGGEDGPNQLLTSGLNDLFKLNLRGLVADPTDVADGDAWYRSDTDKFLGHKNGITEEFLMRPDVANSRNLYVDIISGSDANEGSEAFPFQTIQHAIDEAAIYNAANPTHYVIINIAPGDYTAEGTLDIATLDLHKLAIVGQIDSDAKADIDYYQKGAYPVIIDQLWSDSILIANLEFLMIKNICFNWFVLSCNELVNNYFGTEAVVIENVQVLAAHASIHSAENVYLNNVNLPPLKEIETSNIPYLRVEGCSGSGMDIANQSTAAYPIGWDSSHTMTAYLTNCKFENEVWVWTGGAVTGTPAVEAHFRNGCDIAEIYYTQSPGGIVHCYAEPGCHIEKVTASQGPSVLYIEDGASVNQGNIEEDLVNLTIINNTFDPEQGITADYDSGVSVYINIHTGNDNFNGSREYPFKTIQAAIDYTASLASYPTATFYIAPGDYTAQGTILVRNLYKARFIGEGKLIPTKEMDEYTQDYSSYVHISIIRDGENANWLEYLELTNLKFRDIDMIENSSYVGVSNYFLYQGLFVNNCIIDNTIMVASGYRISVHDSSFNWLFADNVNRMELSNCVSDEISGGNDTFNNPRSIRDDGLFRFYVNDTKAEYAALYTSTDTDFEFILTNSIISTIDSSDATDGTADITLNTGAIVNTIDDGNFVLTMNGGTYAGRDTTPLSLATVVFGDVDYNPEPNTFYVDTASGNDKFNGSRKYPLATLTKAFELVDIAADIDATQHYIVRLAPGDYTGEGSVGTYSTNLQYLTIEGTPSSTKSSMYDDQYDKDVKIHRLYLNDSIAFEKIVLKDLEINTIYGEFDFDSSLHVYEGLHILDCTIYSMSGLYQLYKVYMERCTGYGIVDIHDTPLAFINDCQFSDFLYFRHYVSKTTISELDIASIDCYVSNTEFFNSAEAIKDVDIGVNPLVNIYLDNSHVGSYINAQDLDTAIYMNPNSFAEDIKNGGDGTIYMNGGVLGDTAQTSLTTQDIIWNEYNPAPNILHVSKAGNDAYNGSSKYPLLTIQAAIDACDGSTPTTILIGPGVYTGKLILKNNVYLEGIVRNIYDPDNGSCTEITHTHTESGTVIYVPIGVIYFGLKNLVITSDCSGSSLTVRNISINTSTLIALIENVSSTIINTSGNIQSWGYNLLVTSGGSGTKVIMSGHNDFRVLGPNIANAAAMWLPGTKRLTVRTGISKFYASGTSSNYGLNALFTAKIYIENGTIYCDSPSQIDDTVVVYITGGGAYYFNTISAGGWEDDTSHVAWGYTSNLQTSGENNQFKLNLRELSADPSDAANGDAWSTTTQFRGQRDGVIKNFLMEGDASGWPYSTNLITVDPGGNADHTTIQAAIDAAVSGNIIYIAPAIYNEQVVLKDGVHLYGMMAVDYSDPDPSGSTPLLTYTHTSSGVTLDISGVGSHSRIHNLAIEAITTTSAVDVYAVRNNQSGASIDLYDCVIKASTTSTGTAYGTYVDSDAVIEFYNTSSASSGVSRYGAYNASVGSKLEVVGGVNTVDIMMDAAGGTIELKGGLLKITEGFTPHANTSVVYEGGEIYFTENKNVLYVSQVRGSDLFNGSERQPFATIQAAIDTSKDNDTILIEPGDYTEEIVIRGINKTIRGLTTEPSEWARPEVNIKGLAVPVGDTIVTFGDVTESAEYCNLENVYIYGLGYTYSVKAIGTYGYDNVLRSAEVNTTILLDDWPEFTLDHVYATNLTYTTGGALVLYGHNHFSGTLDCVSSVDLNIEDGFAYASNINFGATIGLDTSRGGILQYGINLSPSWTKLDYEWTVNNRYISEELVGSAAYTRLAFEGRTTDPTAGLVDGHVWYRSDTDEYLGRANATTKKFLMKGDAIEVEGFTTTQIPTGTTVTIDCSLGRFHRIDLGSATGDVTVTITNAVEGVAYAIQSIQGPVRRQYIWPSSVVWPGGTAPSMSVADNSIDFIQLLGTPDLADTGLILMGNFGLKYS